MSASVVAAVLGIAVVDSINPSALAMTGYLIARPDPWRNVRAYIAGIFTLYCSAGLIVTLAFGRAVDTIVEKLSSPSVPYGIEVLIGVAALVYALRAPTSGSSRGLSLSATLTPWRAFGLGLTITAVESTTAIPYLGALAAISRSDPSAVATVALLFAYNVVFIAPPTILALSARYAGGNLLERLRHGGPKPLGRGRRIMRVSCGAVGIVLILDGALYFLTGDPLLPA